MILSPEPSRRDQQRERVRAAILDAAAQFMQERSGEAFSVDALARRAGVSRRTVFNHFASLDDVVTGVCERMLALILEGVAADFNAQPPADSTPLTIRTELVRVLRGLDLAPAISSFADALLFQGQRVHAERAARETFALVQRNLFTMVQDRHPQAEPLDVLLLTTMMLQGVAAIADTWIEETDGDLTDASRARWDELLNYLLSGIWSGLGRNGALTDMGTTP